MLKYSTLAIYTVIALFVFSCASGPSSVQFTSAKTKARSEKNLKEEDNLHVGGFPSISANVNANVQNKNTRSWCW